MVQKIETYLIRDGGDYIHQIDLIRKWLEDGWLIHQMQYLPETEDLYATIIVVYERDKEVNESVD